MPKTPPAVAKFVGVVPNSVAAADRVAERRRAVALARHFREAEGLSIAEIADRLGRSAATVKAYFYDPTGAKARAVKSRYQGVCRGCGASTRPRNGKGDAYAYCKACHPGAIEPRWTHGLVLDAMREWQVRYDRPPSSYDWSRTHARRRGGEALRRLAEGQWPSASAVTALFGTWATARQAASALQEDGRAPSMSHRPTESADGEERMERRPTAEEAPRSAGPSISIAVPSYEVLDRCPSQA